MLFSLKQEAPPSIGVSTFIDTLYSNGLMGIYDILISNDNYQTDNVDLVYNIKEKIGETTFYKG